MAAFVAVRLIKWFATTSGRPLPAGLSHSCISIHGRTRKKQRGQPYERRTERLCGTGTANRTRCVTAASRHDEYDNSPRVITGTGLLHRYRCFESGRNSGSENKDGCTVRGGATPRRVVSGPRLQQQDRDSKLGQQGRTLLRSHHS